jgi:hypothetical protein
MTDVSNIAGLDLDAWERWVAYRKAIRKPLKEVSLHAAALKLSKYGADQSEVVNQSISNQWQGLFELKKAKIAPGEKPEKTDKQKAADLAALEAMESRNRKFWDSVLHDPIMRLRLCDALLARYEIRDDMDVPDRIDELKDRVAEFIRAADPAKVLGDPHVKSMVWKMFGDRGINRLKSLANAAATA